ncbi:MAG TPA: hypothetical protein VN688_09060 [Gemmataceae bacterium]|nr:hypothetical protein [Gemmataceae bacterium]
MAVMNLESLVLCGSSVLLGGKTENPRLGTSYTANSETPEIRISMRHPSRDARQEFQPAMRLGHAEVFRVDSLAVYGAGRSLRRAGVLSYRSSTRLSATDAARLSMRGSPAAIVVVKRCPAGLAWCKPANKTPSASTWGLGVR